MMASLLRWYSSLVLLLLCSNALAGEELIVPSDSDPASSSSTQGPETAEPDSDDSTLLTRMLDAIDSQLNSLNSQLGNTARQVDNFFGDDRAYEDAANTRGQVTLEATKQKGEATEYDIRVRIKIQLPRTQEKLRLLVESDAPEVEEEPTTASSPLQAAEDTNYSLALETLVPVLKEWNIAPAIGVEADLPPDPYFRVRATRYFDLQPWLSRFSTNAVWYAIGDPTVTVKLDFDRQMSEPLLFRVATNLKWKQEEDAGDSASVTQSLTLYQKLSRRRSASYSVSASADSENQWAVQGYGVGAAYRQLLYKNWLFGEVNPFVGFSRDNDWDAAPGITLRVEALFGQ